MAKEVLYIPEEKLKELVLIIRAGVFYCKHYNIRFSDDTLSYLKEWCDNEEEYLKGTGMWEEKKV